MSLMLLHEVETGWKPFGYNRKLQCVLLEWTNKNIASLLKKDNGALRNLIGPLNNTFVIAEKYWFSSSFFTSLV